MAVHVIADRVQETTTTTGTGAIALGGASAQCQSFINAVGDGNECDYVLLSGDGTNWESGTTNIHAGSPPTLTRDHPLQSTNAGAAISLSGTSTVFLAPTAARLYGRLGRKLTRPNYSSFTWVNQSTAFATDYNNGPITLVAPPVSGDQLRCLTQAVPAAPWTLTAELETLQFNIGSQLVGIVVFDSAGKAVTLQQQYSSQALNYQHWASTSSLASTVKTIPFVPGEKIWLRLYNDGTNMNAFVSINGADWISFYSEAVTAYLGTISSAGFLADNNSSTAPSLPVSCWSFELVAGTGNNTQWV